ncbi:hypothetical protein OG579_17190 [Williamsia herbipolensis]|uniref:Recombinase domain-containing protein n=1 Tax=Williamsia herbipolensis TaxID=1603258 RepID=A0AAU4K061_9NOCA|nr:hypothetical protein [Williamsia herbipolensis]
MRAYGWQTGSVVDEAEAKQIREWAAAIKDGASLRSLAAAANETGLATASGSGKWAPLTIKRALLSTRNAGTILEQDVADDLGELLQAPERARFASTNTGTPSWLLRLVMCGICGEPMWMQRFSDRAPDMKCTAGGCGRVAVRQSHIEADAEARIVARLSDARWRSALAAATSMPPEHWESQRDLAHERMVHLAETFGGLESTRVAFDRGVAAAREVVTEAERALDHISVTADLPEVDDVVEWWEQLPTDRRADIARIMIDHITVMSRSAGPDRLRYFWIGD